MEPLDIVEKRFAEVSDASQSTTCAVLPGRGKPSRPAFPKSKAGLGPFKAVTVFNQSTNLNKY